MFHEWGGREPFKRPVGRPVALVLGLSLAAAVSALAAAATCLAGPGSGTAQMWPQVAAQAGAYNRWTIRYTATEDFYKDGGMVTIQIPPGWSVPQKSDSSQTGFIRVTIANPDDLDSFTVAGSTVRVYLGGRSGRFFSTGEYFELIYGASAAMARTQTTAPATAVFTVSSDPNDSAPLPLASGSPQVTVVPGSVSRIAVLFGGVEAGPLSFTADDNSNVFVARGFDVYGNVITGLPCTWQLTQPIGLLIGGIDSTNTLNATRVGTAFLTADDGLGHRDSTGLITVSHGAYARLDVAQPDSAVVGEAFQVSVAALDVDGNTITSGPGSAASLSLSAWLDSLAVVPGSGVLSVGSLNLAGGQASVDETYLIPEAIFVRARDVSDTTKSDFGPRPTVVKPTPAYILTIVPDTLQVSAGSQGTFMLTSKDAYGNLSPVESEQTLYLWKNSSHGEFRATGAAQQIYEVKLKADSSSVSFDYYDTVASDCQVAVMDVDTNPPHFSPVGAIVRTTHGQADTLVVSGISDPVTAGVQTGVVVEARDAFGNRVRGYSGTVRFTSTDTGGQTVLPADYVFLPSDSGRRVFPLSVTLTTAGEHSVAALDLAFPSVRGAQSGITVFPSVCDSLALAVSQNPVTAGTWLDLTVRALDQYGNKASGYAGVIDFSSTDSGDSTVLPGAYEFAVADSGLHVFAGGIRLTQAGSHTISAADTAQAGINGETVGVLVTAGIARSVVLFPPDSFQVNAGGTQVLRASVEDGFGNPREGEQTSVVIKDTADGSLEDDPGNPNDTSGGASVQTGMTDASGEITVRYRGPITSGLRDTLDAYCTTVSHSSVADVLVRSTPSGATALRLLPAQSLADTAGAVFAVRVEATDSFGNLDASDTSLVRITLSSTSGRVSVNGGATWSTGNADSLKLVAGSTQARLQVTGTTAGKLDVLAEDAAKVLVSALKDNITVWHAFPAGNILVSSSRDTLIADGSSSASLVAGPVRDSYGNSVSGGEKVTVSSLLCDIVSADMDTAVAGTQLLTAPDGRVYFAVRAGGVAGPDTVAVNSFDGTAAGTRGLVLLTPPSFQFVAGSVSPMGIAGGETVSFEVELDNVGGARVALSPISTFSLTDGNDGTFVAALTSTAVALPGERIHLVFEPRLVGAQLDPGPYSPLLSLAGTDQTGRPFAQAVQAGVNAVQLVSMRLRSVFAPSSVVRGQQDVAVDLTLKNESSVPLEVGGVGLTFSSPAHTYSLAQPSLPDTVAGGEIRTFTFLVDVGASAPVGQCIIDAFANGVSAGTAVIDVSADSTATWLVQSEAALSYVAGSLSPANVAAGQTRSFSLRMLNSGTAPIQLDTTGTYVRFGSAPDEYVASLAAPALLPGSAEAGVAFRSARVPPGMPAGTYQVEISLRGTENGAPFSETLFSDPDSVVVAQPGDITVLETVVSAPNAPFVDTSQVFSVEVEVENLGAEKALNVVVSVSSDGGSAVTSPVNFGDVDGGATKRMAFSVRASGSGGTETFTSSIESATGAISGLPLVVAGALDDTAAAIVQTPALLSVSAAVAEPGGAVDGTVSTEQVFKVRATVQNLGEGAVRTGGALSATVPAGFVLLSPQVQGFTPGVQVEWSVRAPSAQMSAAPLRVSVSSLPAALNTGVESDTLSGSQVVALSVVNKAELSLAAAIVAPPVAVDGSVPVGTAFTVQATVSNAGSAATNGTGKVAISLPSGYALGGGEMAEKDFTVGVPVSWNVTSPSSSTPIRYLSVTISQAPLDENTDAQAAVSVGTRQIAVYAESKHLVAETLASVEAPAQVAANQNSVRMMAVRISNPDDPGDGSTMGLRSLSVYVLDDNNSRLADPSAALSGISVSRYSGSVLGVASGLASNPVRVDFAPQADTLRPGESDTLVVSIDVSPAIQVGGIALEIDGGSAFEAFEQGSGESIPVLSPDGSDFPQTLSAPSKTFTRVHNFPNPFRAGREVTSISYYLESDSRVAVRIYTLDGKPVYSKTFSADDPEGRHGLREITWDGRNGDGKLVLNGVYICRLEASGVNATFKIAVAK